MTSLQPLGYCFFFNLNNGNLKLVVAFQRIEVKQLCALEPPEPIETEGHPLYMGRRLRRELENGSTDMRQHN